MAGIHSLLTATNLYCIAFVLLSLYCIVGSLVNYCKLRGFRGPPLASISRIYIFWKSLRCKLSDSEYEALRKYGSPVRLSPNLLVTDDANVLRHMSAPRSLWRRGPWYNAMRLDPRQDSVFSTRDETFHTELRSKMIGGYNGSTHYTIEPAIDDRIAEFIELLRNTYSGQVFDFAEKAQLFTLDVLSTVAFGKSFGNLQADKDIYGFTKAEADFQTILELMNNHAVVRWLFTSNLVQRLTAPKGSDTTGIGPILKIAQQTVAERFGACKIVKKDILGHFVDKGLTKTQCEVEANLQIIAGSDSTTTILRCTLWHLITTPTAYMKLRSEIDVAVQSGAASAPVITWAEAQKLDYLDACLWEGIRMWPPLIGLKSKVAPKGGDTIKGVFYPEGTEVGLCDRAMCRNEKIFGSDAGLFRPERWLEADEETRKRYRYVVDSVFGSGKWTCLGREIAMRELWKVVFELLRSFDWAVADPMLGVKMYSHGIHVQTGMNVFMHPKG